MVVHLSLHIQYITLYASNKERIRQVQDIRTRFEAIINYGWRFTEPVIFVSYFI